MWIDRYCIWMSSYLLALTGNDASPLIFVFVCVRKVRHKVALFYTYKTFQKRLYTHHKGTRENSKVWVCVCMRVCVGVWRCMSSTDRELKFWVTLKKPAFVIMVSLEELLDGSLLFFPLIVSLFLYLRHIYFTHTHMHTQQVNGEAMLFIITRPEKWQLKITASYCCDVLQPLWLTLPWVVTSFWSAVQQL